MPRLPLLLAAVLTLPLVACASPLEDDEAVSFEQEVEGGRIDTSTANNFAVGITSGDNAVCTGTLIAPNLVLTARHCVVPEQGDAWVTCKTRFPEPLPPSELEVTTSPNIYRAEQFHPAKKIFVPADDGFCGNDLALILLEDNIPASEATPAVPVVGFDITDRTKLGDQIVALGYGLTNPSARDSGLRRMRENIGILCVPGSADLACTGDLAGLADSDAEFVTEGFVCSGDSGGGAFDQRSFGSGRPFVLGTLSRGPQTDKRCLAAIYTRTDRHAELIVEAATEAATAGAYALPDWAAAPIVPRVGETVCTGDVCTSTLATAPETDLAPRERAGGCSVSTPAPGAARSSALLGLSAALLVFARRVRARRPA